MLEQLHITHVVSVCVDVPDVPGRVEQLALRINDDPSVDLLANVVPAACAFIGDAMACGGRVLVHCNAGVSRSASVVIAHLMQHERLSFCAARAAVARARPVIDPNHGFVAQLEQFKVGCRSLCAPFLLCVCVLFLQSRAG